MTLHDRAIAIDATCGNGHDTLFLASEKVAMLYAIDIQEEALESTRRRLIAELDEEHFRKVSFQQRCHSTFPEEIKAGTVSLIVYNLGYLPSGDKSKTTLALTTLQSLNAALLLLCHGGVISITCYPGHPQGELEEQELLKFSSMLDPSEWSCCHHRWTNRKKSPSLLLIQRCIGLGLLSPM